MHSLFVLVATAALGVEAGWQPLPEGGHEYTIQIEPQLLRMLQTGTEELVSEVPADVDVRRYRIVVGTGPLPRDVGSQPRVDPVAQPIAADPVTPPEEGGTPDFGQAADDAFDRYDVTEPVDPYDVPVGSEPADAPHVADDGAGKYGDAPRFPETAEVPDAGSPPADSPSAVDDDPWAMAPEPDTREEGASDADPGAASDMLPIAADQRRTDAAAPAKLPGGGDGAGPIQPAAFDEKTPSETAGADGADAFEANRPKLPDEGQSRPWLVLVVAVALLCLSLGGNVYLAWIAWDARNRYRGALAKWRGATT